MSLSTAQTSMGSSWDTLSQSFVMIVVSEIGDKTFLIAAIMATRHPRLTVFGGAFASLMVMSILSAAMGKVVLGLIPAKYTHYVASLLFLVFGLKMIQEGLSIPAGNAHIQGEMKEVEDELEEEEGMMDLQGRESQIEMEEGRSHGMYGHSNGSASAIGIVGEREDGSSGKRGPSITPGRHNPQLFGSSSNNSKKSHHPLSGSTSSGAHARSSSTATGSRSAAGFVDSVRAQWTTQKVKESTRNFCSLFFSPVFAQAFILTFLGEWGDRSQIATIALGGANSVPVVAFGTILGHAVCTAGAVIGGRLLSTRISVRYITLIGAAAFLIFAAIYFYEGWTTKASDML